MKRLLWLTQIVLLSVFYPIAVLAHSPHDVVESVAISPAYESDQTLFIYVFDELKRSTDGGHTWQVLEQGLDNTSALISDITTSSGDAPDYTVFLSTQGDGVYRSTDRGDHWRAVNVGLANRNIHRLVLSPDFENDRTLVAIPHGSGLFVSTDAGDSWRQVAREKFSASSLMVVQESDKTRLLVGTESGDIYLSDDEFEHWVKQAGVEGSGAISDISQQVTDGSKRVIFFGTALKGLFKSYDLGRTSLPVSLPSATENREKASYVTSVDAIENRQGSADVFVTRWHDALFYSSNAGNSWEKLASGLKRDPQADTYKTAHFYQSEIPPGFSKHGHAFIAGFSGLFKTSDGGGSWIEMETRQARNVEGLALSPTYSSDRTVALASYDGGAYLSKDSGKTWVTQNIGLPSTHLWDIAVAGDAKNGVTIYAASNPAFLILDEQSPVWFLNNLATSTYWKHITANFAADSIVTKIARRILDKPGLPFPTQIAVSKKFTLDETLFLGTRYKGVLKSVDSGATWKPSWSVDDGWITSLKISPSFDEDSTLFAAVRKRGVYLSVDGGERWQLRNRGLSPLAIDYEQLGTSVFELSPEFSSDHRVYFGSADGLYLSTDMGQQWSRVKVSENGQQEMIRAIGISPDFAVDGTLFVSVKGRGLYRSNDRGASFSPIAPELIKQHKVMKLFRFSPEYAKDRTIFAASAEEVYLSRDAGNNWALLERPIRYEDTKDNIIYDGAWERRYNAESSAMNVHQSNAPGAKATLRFYGRQVTWFGPMAAEYGTAKVYIDGDLVKRVEQFSSAQKRVEPIFTSDELSQGNHTLTIEVANDKSEDAANRYIVIDALEVF